MRHLPSRTSLSSSTLTAANFSGSTPCSPRIWIEAREKPHCGVSGVPFMKRTTGVFSRVLLISFFVSSERRRSCWNWNRGTGRDVRRSRVVCRRLFRLVFLLKKKLKPRFHTCLNTENLEDSGAMVMMMFV